VACRFNGNMRGWPVRARLPIVLAAQTAGAKHGRPRMTKLRLVADDLTGALDSAAQFVARGKTIPVFVAHHLPRYYPDEFALDSGSRERDGDSAADAAGRLAHLLVSSPGVISFKKVDSLLRGNPGREIAATMRVIAAPACVIAPAFPYHGRVTRAGLQYVRDNESWSRAGEDLRATLKSQGMSVQLMHPGDTVPAGISIWDAETDEDLRRIAAEGAAFSGGVLWCGSGGLAAALSPPVHLPPGLPRIAGPLLGLFGSDHAATAAQLRACGADVVSLRIPDSWNRAIVSEKLADAGVCHVRFDLPSDTGRSEASSHISEAIGDLTQSIAPPRSLVVAGGETLRALCAALGTDHLAVTGQIFPGVPVSRMVGGRWDGATVISKSGSFGSASLIREIATSRDR
jgi:D-threonate/D-erythronate kinase